MKRFSVTAFLFLVCASLAADLAQHILDAVLRNGTFDYRMRDLLNGIRPYPWRCALWGTLFGLVCVGCDTHNRKIGASDVLKLLFLPPIVSFIFNIAAPMALGTIPHFPIPPQIITTGLFAASLAFIVNESVYVGYGPGTIVWAGLVGAAVFACNYAGAPLNYAAGFFYLCVGTVLAFAFASDA